MPSRGVTLKPSASRHSNIPASQKACQLRSLMDTLEVKGTIISARKRAGLTEAGPAGLEKQSQCGKVATHTSSKSLNVMGVPGGHITYSLAFSH